MVDTGFWVPPEKVARLIDPPVGAEILPDRDVTKPTTLFSGGGGLVSTASDYLRFCQMLLNGGELDGVRILSPATVRRRHKATELTFDGFDERDRCGALKSGPRENVTMLRLAGLSLSQ